MKNLEQILKYPGGDNCNFIDSRDKARLIQFIPLEHWEALGFSPAEGVDPSTLIKPLTEENVKKQLATDLAFAFDKALDQRGISSNLMHDVIKMWMWVLDDCDLFAFACDNSNYPNYGLPLYVKVATKYNLPNPIGQDTGTEAKYGN